VGNTPLKRRIPERHLQTQQRQGMVTLQAIVMSNRLPAHTICADAAQALVREQAQMQSGRL
jgi:hypothetical protein